MKHNWTDKEKLTIVEYLKRGISLFQIARHIGVSYDSLQCVIKRMRCDEKWRSIVPYIKPTLDKINEDKIGILDIETSNLNSNRGYILTYVIKQYGKNNYYKDIIKAKDLRRGLYDRNVVKKLIKDLQFFDIIIGYYSSGFDIPFIRGRAVFHKLDFPHFGSLRHIDLFYKVKYKYGLSRNSLQEACRMCGIKGKTHIDMSIWLDAATFGCKKSLNEIYKHNIADVKITEKLYDNLKNYFKWEHKPI